MGILTVLGIVGLIFVALIVGVVIHAYFASGRDGKLINKSKLSNDVQKKH